MPRVSCLLLKVGLVSDCGRSDPGAWTLSQDSQTERRAPVTLASGPPWSPLAMRLTEAAVYCMLTVRWTLWPLCASNSLDSLNNPMRLILSLSAFD